MIPGSFEYHRPANLSQAVALLGQLDSEARVIAGGHSLIPMMKLRLAMPSHLVDLAGVPELKGVHLDGGEIVIGAMVTQHEIIVSDLLARHAPILRETAEVIADPQVRYVGTIGGNVANGDPGNDMPALMMTLGATYVLRGASGERRIAARDYYLSPYETAAKPGEVLAAVRVPVPPAGHGWAYEKLKRKVGDYATAAAAVILTVSGGTIATCAIGLTNVAGTALFAGRRGGLGRRDRARQADPRTRRSRCDGDRGARRRRTRLGRISRQDGGRHDRASADPRLRARQILKGPDMSLTNVSMTVNGKSMSAAVEPRTLLIHYLRENLGLTGAHIGCDTSHCGACTVDVDGRSVKSCTMFAVQAAGANVLTIEGMAGADGALSALQEGFREMHGLQCGYCTPGMIIRAHRLLQENPSPSESEIRIGISGNLCRCTGYQNIVRAIQYAAAKMAGLEFKEAAE